MRSTTRGAAACLALLAAAFTVTALGGGGPQNVLVVVNDRSIESQELGLYYAERRGIPQRNICHIALDPLTYNLSAAAFQTGVTARIHNHIQAQGLSNQIDFIVLCKDIPSRVNDNESATAVLFYGFKNIPAGNYTLPPATSNLYYRAERAFRHRDRYGDTNGFITFLLTASNLVEGLTNVDNSVASDGTAPTGTFYFLEPPGDPPRAVRYTLFDNLDFSARLIPGFPNRSFIVYDWISNRPDVMGYLTGNAKVFNDHRGITNTFLPGAFADHMTSYGGRLPNGVSSGGSQTQDTVMAWIHSGAVASYGTVNEPANWTYKFPDPMTAFWYARGFSMGESYLMSVANPFQGLFVGDPLAAPYAVPPTIAITNLAPDDTVSGIVTVQVTAAEGPGAQRCSAIDLYVDDLYAATLTNVPPRAGNVLDTTVDGVRCTYTVGSTDLLYSAVAGLAQAINNSNLAVRATALGDRLLLIYTNFGYPGTAVTYSATTATGTAAELTVHAVTPSSSNLLECTYKAREYVRLTGTANTGDTVTCKIALTNGVVATNVIVAAQGESAAAVMTRMFLAIAFDPLLQGTNGVRPNAHAYVVTDTISLDARRPGPEGYNLFVDWDVDPVPPFSGLSTNDSFSDQFNDNHEVLTARGSVLFLCGRTNLSAAWTWDTTAFADGPHTIRAVARNGAAAETQGHVVLPVVISNSAFTVSLVAPTSGQHVVLGTSLTVHALATNAAGSTTQVIVRIEGKTAATLAAAPHITTWETTNAGVGEVSVSAEAWDTSGGVTISAPVTVIVDRSPTMDTDGDGLPDSWEQSFFGGLYITRGADDPDSDGLANSNEFLTGATPTLRHSDTDGMDDFEEYIADTDPADSNSFFEIQIGPWSNSVISVDFQSSSGRQYLAEFNDGFRTNFYDWQASTGQYFWGANGPTNWIDDGTETGTHPSNIALRVYRMRVRRQ